MLVPPPARPLGRVRGGDAGRATNRARRPRRGNRPGVDPDRRAWHRAQATPTPMRTSRRSSREPQRARSGGLAAAAPSCSGPRCLHPTRASVPNAPRCSGGDVRSRRVRCCRESSWCSRNGGGSTSSRSVRAEILHAEVSFARVGDFMDAENESRREREKEAILLLTAAERLGHGSRARARGSPRSAAGGVLPSRLRAPRCGCQGVCQVRSLGVRHDRGVDRTGTGASARAGECERW